jgi:hypothetical protein
MRSNLKELLDGSYDKDLVKFEVNEVALKQVFLRVLQFFLLIIIPPLLHTLLSPPREVCYSSDEAAHYRTPGSKSLTRHLAGLGVNAD